jgi:hypothetical protein
MGKNKRKHIEEEPLVINEEVSDSEERNEERPLVINEEVSDSEERNEEVSDSEERNEDVSDSEELTESFKNTLKLIPDSEIFVIKKDDEPVCYHKSSEKAKHVMWELARKDMGDYSRTYNVFIKEDKHNTVTLVGYYRFLLVAYERVLCKYEVSSAVEQIDM